MGVIFTIPLVLLLLVHLIHISAVPSLSHPLLDISNCLDLGCWKRGDGTRKAASWERGQHLQHYIRQRGESLIRAVRWSERPKGKHFIRNPIKQLWVIYSIREWVSVMGRVSYEFKCSQMSVHGDDLDCGASDDRYNYTAQQTYRN